MTFWCDVPDGETASRGNAIRARQRRAAMRRTAVRRRSKIYRSDWPPPPRTLVGHYRTLASGSFGAARYDRWP